MLMLIIPAVAMGIFAAFGIAFYAMLCIDDPYDRVAFYLTILSSEVVISILAYILLGSITGQFIATFALTKNLIWSIVCNHRNMVHFRVSED